MVSTFLPFFSSELRARPSLFGQPYVRTALGPIGISALADTFVLSMRLLLLRTS